MWHLFKIFQNLTLKKVKKENQSIYYNVKIYEMNLMT